MKNNLEFIIHNWRVMVKENVIADKSKGVAGFTALLLTIIMIIGCFATACQPTPEELIVQNKADDDLQEAIAQTANPETEQNETVSNNTDQVEDSIMVTDAISNDLGTIKININSNVILPDNSQVPVAYVEPVNFTQDQLENIINAFYGDVVFYDGFTQTKTDIEKRIVRMQELLSNDEKLLNSDYPSLMSVPGMPPETDVSKLREYVNTRIERRRSEWESAPEEYVPLSNDVIKVQPDNEFFFIKTDIGKDYMGYVSYSNSYSSPGINTRIECFAFENDYNLSDALLKDISLLGRVLKPYNSTQVDINTNDSGYEYAKQLAQGLIDEIGIDGVKLEEAYISGDTVTLTSSQEGSGLTYNGVIKSSEKEYYVFCFERIIGNQTIDYTFYDGRSQMEEAVHRIDPYEKIEVWVDGNEIVQFIWDTPAKVTDIINENVAVDKDYTKAIDNMTQQAFIKYADLHYGLASEIVIDIDKMELVMARILERDTNKYLVVPVWKFYGEVTAVLKDSEEESRIISSSGKSIITINALDNTIIELQNGY